MTEKEYNKLVKSMMPRSAIWKDCAFAFVIGILICAVGQLSLNGCTVLGLEETDASTGTSMTLVALSPCSPD